MKDTNKFKIDAFYEFLTQHKRFVLYGSGIITLLIVLIYSNVFNNTAHFDDNFIFNNVGFRSLSDFKQLLGVNKLRIIPFFTFFLNYQFSKDNLVPYYIVNVLIHIINSLLVFWFIRKIFQTPYLKDNDISKYSKFLALFGALIFAVHPIQTQAVSYIYQRLASLSATFYLSASIFYLNGRMIKGKTGKKALNFLISGLFLIMGFFTKENTFTFPFTMIVLELMLFNKNFKLKPIYAVIALFLIAFGIFALFRFTGYYTVFTPYQNFNNEEVNALGYFITQFKVYPLYFFMLFFPVNQNFDHDIRFSYTFADPYVIFGMIIVLATLVLGVIFAQKYRLAAFGLFWFYATIAIESSVIPIADVMNEHRLYLPMVGFVLILANLLYEIGLKRSEKKTYIFVTVVIALLSIATFARNLVWQNDETLWRDVVSKSPHKARGLYNLGMYYYNLKQGKEAYEYFQKAIEANPKFTSPYLRIGTMYFNSKDYVHAIEEFRKMYDLGDSYEKGIAGFNMAKMFVKLNEYDSAWTYVDTYVRRYQSDMDGHKLRSEIALKLGKIKIAQYDMNIIKQTTKDNFEPLVKFAQIQNEQKKYQEAIKSLSEAIDGGSDNLQMLAFAFNLRGTIYYNLKDYQMAVIDFENATSVIPNYMIALRNKVLSYRALGQNKDALDAINQIISINPSESQAYVERAKIYIDERDSKQARDDLKKAVALNPGNTEAQTLLSKYK